MALRSTIFTDVVNPNANAPKIGYDLFEEASWNVFGGSSYAAVNPGAELVWLTAKAGFIRAFSVLNRARGNYDFWSTIRNFRRTSTLGANINGKGTFEMLGGITGETIDMGTMPASEQTIMLNLRMAALPGAAGTYVLCGGSTASPWAFGIIGSNNTNYIIHNNASLAIVPVAGTALFQFAAGVNYFLMLTYNPTTRIYTSYINGVLQGATNPAPAARTDNSFVVGGYTVSFATLVGKFAGSLQDPRVINRDLSLSVNTIARDIYNSYYLNKAGL